MSWRAKRRSAWRSHHPPASLERGAGRQQRQPVAAVEGVRRTAGRLDGDGETPARSIRERVTGVDLHEAEAAIEPDAQPLALVAQHHAGEAVAVALEPGERVIDVRRAD